MSRNEWNQEIAIMLVMIVSIILMSFVDPTPHHYLVLLGVAILTFRICVTVMRLYTGKEKQD